MTPQPPLPEANHRDTATTPAEAGAESGGLGEPGVGLDQLPPGTLAVVIRMDETDHAMMIRLKTMGMHPGRAVRVLRRGSRMIVTCGGTRIGLSATVARHIRVEPTKGE